ncbi:MAG TPA: SRPBCC domain-containing protein [Terracidiphilus sp.]|nr:SRPBCC domain-containing protein [Terracidiphilus sp.]
MPAREILHELLVNVSPEQLYQAVTGPAQIAHWWTTGARGESTLGKQLEFWFGDYCASIAEITALEPGKLVRWHVTGGKAKDWIETDLEFRIFVEDGRTMLHFRHSNWREDARQFAHCSFGWAIFLLSLKEFAETGKGRPYPYDMPVNMWKPPATAA